MYAATQHRFNDQPRHEQWDLGLSPREESRLQEEFKPALRALTSGANLPAGLWSEVGADARKRAHLGDAPANTLTIPTGARVWAPTRVDVLAAMKRDATVAGSGGYLVATQNLSFIELLRNRMVAFAMGATRMSGLVGNVTIPKQTVGATAYWLASEDTAITEGNQTFAQIPLTPNTVGAYTEISRLLQLQSSPSADAIIMSDLAQSVANAADLAVLAGTGTEQPTGILGTPSIGTFTGTSLDTAALLNAQTDVASANALTPTCGYVTTAAVAGLLMARQRFAGPTGDPLWSGNLLDGTVLGMKAMSSAQMPAATMIFGNWAEVVIGEWGVLELATNPFADFAKGISGIRATYTLDVAVRHAGAFSYSSSIT